MLMNLLAFLAGSLPTLILLAYLQRMNAEREQQWMRIFSAKSLEIPATTMDGSPVKEETKLRPDTRKRLSVPLAADDYAKDAYRAIKRGIGG